ncbi:vacuolar protein sorting-associated protein 4 isoform X2 [Spinacia oleracea]|uniref:Vacuolar protein sorting-associated protein 4 isoform X2 n=1 Tax=Spinacia oleracea TaxID=3562 RepID=A0A9R0JK89_SPIOL|nr:vacuolar protein sorting-associated protein 4 isoform X2 [Spinacia oleracea]
MSTFSRLLTRRVWRSAITSSKTINPTFFSQSQPQSLHVRLYHVYGTQQPISNAFKGRIPFFSFEPMGSLCIPLVLAGVVGVGTLDVAYADSNEVSADPPLPSDIPSSYDDLEDIAKKERVRLEDLLRSKGMKYGSYPRFTVAVKGQKVAIKFQVPAYCEIPRLIANLASNLNGGSPMEVQSWDSTVAWQLALSLPNGKRESGGSNVATGETLSKDSDLCVLIFRSLISPDKPEVEFLKKGSFSLAELEALISIMQIAGERPGQSKATESSPAGTPSTSKSITSLEAMGVRVFGLDKPLTGDATEEVSWDTIAGYDQQKREIEDTVLLALRSPEVYDDIARGTRRNYESNRPRAVLFEGPPGTGKTSCARVIANQAGVPLLYVPLEVVMSKYYGESERLFGKVFSLANELPDGAIIFLDEVDSFAIARDSDIHEATRRMLSVLLRQIDGFEQDKKVVVIAATNRKQDIDPALISRFDSLIFFGLPDQQNRQKIAAQYAKHLTNSELEEFALVTEGLSGRDIRDVCQHAERRWASRVIRNKAIKDSTTDAKAGSLPPLQEYVESAIARRKILVEIEELRNQKQSHRLDKRPLVMG